MAQQKDKDYKKKEDEMRAQYEKEQDLYQNRMLVAGSDSKDKLSLNFMYEAPPGLKTGDKKDGDDKVEYKFEWQRNAPRESYAKNNMDIRDQPFGIQVRNVRCLKCHKWGHVNTDRECPLYNTTSIPSSNTVTGEKGEGKSQPIKIHDSELIKSMREEQGLELKKSVTNTKYGPKSTTEEENQRLLPVKDPEVAFLDSLSKKEKKKLLKKLQMLTNANMGIKSEEKKKSKKNKKEKRDRDDYDHHKSKSSKNDHRKSSSDERKRKRDHSESVERNPRKVEDTHKKRLSVSPKRKHHREDRSPKFSKGDCRSDRNGHKSSNSSRKRDNLSSSPEPSRNGCNGRREARRAHSSSYSDSPRLQSPQSSDCQWSPSPDHHRSRRDYHSPRSPKPSRSDRRRTENERTYPSSSTADKHRSDRKSSPKDDRRRHRSRSVEKHRSNGHQSSSSRARR